MPMALTVPAAAREMVQEVEPMAGLQSWLVPELGAGADPSVVYQIETFPIGTGVVLLVFPASVKVTARGKLCAPEAGAMAGIVVVIGEHEEENVLPVALGGGMPR
jgi:hypothetical protein